MRKRTIIAGALLLVAIALCGCGTNNSTPAEQAAPEVEEKPLTSEEIAAAKLEEELEAAYDLGVEDLKSQLKNPSSYKYFGRMISPSKETKGKIYVKIEYNATNSVGGAMDGTYFAIVQDGKISRSFFGDAQSDWDITLSIDMDISNSLF